MSNPNQFPNLQFSLNNRYLGTGSPITVGDPLEGVMSLSWGEMSNANAADAFFKFKQFMVGAGWTVTMSGAAWTANDQLNQVGDMFTNGRLFNLPMIYFVLQDPGSTRQFLFYRSPEATAADYTNDPFTGTAKTFFSYAQASMGSFSTNPTVTPIIKQMTTSTYTGVVSSASGSTVTLSNIYVVGTPNQYLSPDMVGRWITLVPPTGATNPLNTYYLPTAQIQSVLKDTNGLYSIVTITDSSGVTYNSNPGMGFYITDTGAMIGGGANISTSSRVSTVSGLKNMTTKSIGHTLALSTYGTTSDNDGEYLIIDVADSTHATIIARDGQTFDSGEANNGKYFWKECFQAIDYIAISQDRMSIAYSAQSKFTSLHQLSSTAIAANWSVPIATDMVWVSPYEQSTVAAFTPYQYPGVGKGNFFCHSNENKILPSTNWNLHMCASTSAPYPFYMWLTYKETNITTYLKADKQSVPNGSGTNSNVTIANNVPYIYDTLSFFAMDALGDSDPADTDPVLLWCDVGLGAPCRKVGHFPSTVANINCLMPVGQSTPDAISSMRGWYKKPSSFTDPNDFLNKINHMQCGFLPTAVLMYQAVQTFEAGNSRNFVTLIPGNLSTSAYSSNDEIYPMMYARGSIQFQYQTVYHPSGGTGQIKEPFKLPPSYKGRSLFMKVAGMTRNNCDLLNDGAFPKSWVYAGRNPWIVLPWDGSTLPNLE